jgi:hypothetical protein
MHLGSRARRFLWDHPLFWVAVGIPLFMQLCRLPADSWNVEILIARNLLEGHGFVVGPLDPPALWRPPLAVFMLLPIEMLFQSPYYVYSVFGALTLVGLMIGTFYLMKRLGGPVAAHVSQLMILLTPAFTTLVSRQPTVLSYLLLFAMVTFSILATLRSWSRAHWKRDVQAGLCWGIAFLARPEVVALFGVGLLVGFVFRRRLGVSRRQAVSRAVFQASTFLAIYIPSVLVFATVQKQHDLVGQAPLVTYYAGARHANNKVAGDTDGSGYEESVKQFGSPEEYGSSMMRFMLAHPEAIKLRVGQNLKNLCESLRWFQLITLWDCVAFLVLSSALVFARRPRLPSFPVMIYLASLLAASPYFLLFHVDVRYCLLFVLLLVLCVLFLALLWWTWVASFLNLGSTGRRLVVVPTLVLVLLCEQRVVHALTTAPQNVVSLRPWRQLDRGFREHVAIGGTPPVVGFVIASGRMMFGGDALWFSYFGHTAWPWCGHPHCYAGRFFPRDKIYSFTGKPQDYLWIPDNKVSSIKLPNEIVAQRVQVDSYGSYSLLRLTPPGSPVAVEGVRVSRPPGVK